MPSKAALFQFTANAVIYGPFKILFGHIGLQKLRLWAWVIFIDAANEIEVVRQERLRVIYHAR